MDVFCTKYFHEEEIVTLATLQVTKQKSGEDLIEYIKRFKDIALDYYDHYEEKTLVEMCIGNVIMEYRAVLENLEISKFAQLLQKARKTVQSVRPSSDRLQERRSTSQAMVISTMKGKGNQTVKGKGNQMGRSTRPPPLPRHYHVHQRSYMCSSINGLKMGPSSPTKEEQRDSRFYHLHNYVQHPTTEC